MFPTNRDHPVTKKCGGQLLRFHLISAFHAHLRCDFQSPKHSMSTDRLGRFIQHSSDIQTTLRSKPRGDPKYCSLSPAWLVLECLVPERFHQGDWFWCLKMEGKICHVLATKKEGATDLEGSKMNKGLHYFQTHPNGQMVKLC